MAPAEYGAGQANQHWHSCTKPNAAATRIPFAIKGLITDMLAQMVFNKALGPKPSGDDAAEVRSDGEGVNSTGDKHATVRARRARHRHVIARATESQTKQPALRVCTDCPGGILPFHLKPMTDMRNSCYDHVPVLDYKAQYNKDVPACPDRCMKQRANYTIETCGFGNAWSKRRKGKDKGADSMCVLDSSILVRRNFVSLSRIRVGGVEGGGRASAPKKNV